MWSMRRGRSVSLPSPVELGAPAKFSKWRDGQDTVVLDIANSSKRFIAVDLATGGGKSLSAVMQALISDTSCVILTSTKGLQAQYQNDFESIGMLDVKGKSNYDCDYGIMPMRASDGPCNSGVQCSLKVGGCAYYDRVRLAQRRKLVNTNYAFWLAQNRYKDEDARLAPDMLILDEAHDAVAHLLDTLSANFDQTSIKTLTGLYRAAPTTESVAEWTVWMQNAYQAISLEIKNASAIKPIPASSLKTIRKYQDLANRVKNLITDIASDWVIEKKEDHSIQFDPLWPARYAEKYLFAGVKRVILISATIRPKTLQLLGIAPADSEFLEYSNSFKVANRPVYYTPSVKVWSKMTPIDEQWWMSMIDRIIEPRTDRKGIIHSVSFARAQYIVQHSRFRHLMIINASGNTANQVLAFKNSKTPKILVTPSVTTGWDFPGTEAEYTILAKLPYPDTRPKIVKERRRLDKEWEAYQILQTVVQSTGRIVRSETDRGESFLIDSQFGWFIGANKHLIPKWWMQAYRWQTEGLPQPLKKL